MAAKRQTNYTSVSVSKSKLPLVQQLREYASAKLHVQLTQQQLLDFALETAWRQRDELKAFAVDNALDPRVQTYLKLRDELTADGLLAA